MKLCVILAWMCMFARSKILTPSPASILELTKIVKSDWNILEDVDSLNCTTDEDNEILRQINIFDKNITSVSQMVANVSLEIMSEVVNYLTETAKVQITFGDLIPHIHSIDKEYTRMLTYVTNKKCTNNSTLKDFIQNVVISHHADSVRMRIEKIHGFVAPRRNLPGQSSLLKVLSTTKDLDNFLICKSKQSQNQFLYNLYNIISLAYLKAYGMTHFSYIMLMKMYERGSFTGELQTTTSEFEARTIEFANEMKIALNRTSLYFWRCDPDEYQRGINYLEITKLLQGSIQNQIALNNQGTCKEECSFFKYVERSHCSRDPKCSRNSRCNGKLLNCQSVETLVWVCPANLTSGGGDRRYEYIEYQSGKTLGKKEKEKCPQRTELKRWSRKSQYCSYCMCLCDEEGGSDRFFSLWYAASNVTENKVVTGMRFIKKNRMIHLQVQQGELLPQGLINKSTLEWVPVSNFTLTTEFVHNRQDYFKLNWKEKAINLDVFEGEDRHVLTGVRFYMLGSHLNFEVRITPFDFKTGTLIDPRISSRWIYNSNTEYTNHIRTQIDLKNVDVPTRNTSPSRIMSNHNEFLQFTHTDFDKDAAQTTVPFIDAQDVVPDVPVPLSGAGVYFKSTEGYGGFIGLKLVTYDFSKHLNYTQE